MSIKSSMSLWKFVLLKRNSSSPFLIVDNLGICRQIFAKQAVACFIKAAPDRNRRQHAAACLQQATGGNRRLPVWVTLCTKPRNWTATQMQNYAELAVQFQLLLILNQKGGRQFSAKHLSYMRPPIWSKPPPVLQMFWRQMWNKCPNQQQFF